MLPPGVTGSKFLPFTESKLEVSSKVLLITLWTRCGQVGVVKLLLTKGEFVDAKDEEGETPLHKAARQALESLCSI